MIRNEEGFSLVELIVTMVVFVIVIAASSQVFIALLNQFKQQSRIGESNIEGMVGLDILRRDLAGAGFGLFQNRPWGKDPLTPYPTDCPIEAANDSGSQTFWVDRDLNDEPPDNPPRGSDLAGAVNPPAAFRILNNIGAEYYNGSTFVKTPNTEADVLAIKSTNVAFDDGAQKWTYISNRGATWNIKGWDVSDENLTTSPPAAMQDQDRVIVLYPSPTRESELMLRGSKFWSDFDSNPITTTMPKPTQHSYRNYVVYGIAIAGPDPNKYPRMPFNRADYYVKRPVSMPSRCANNTTDPKMGPGILYKAVLNQSDGLHTELPLIDCVADFQVDFLLDTTASPDGFADWPPDDGTLLNNYTAADIRSRLKEVRVYIVAQEGQKDLNYDFSQGGTREMVSTVETLSTFNPSTNATVNNSRTLNFVNLKTLVGDPEYKYYRWKLYTIVVQPNNLR